jgi:predicted HAD superfamily phosphohydrolase
MTLFFDLNVLFKLLREQAFDIDENERILNEEKQKEMLKLFEEQKQIEKEERIKKLNEWKVNIIGSEIYIKIILFYFQDSKRN